MAFNVSAGTMAERLSGNLRADGLGVLRWRTMGGGHVTVCRKSLRERTGPSAGRGDSYTRTAQRDGVERDVEVMVHTNHTNI